MDYFKQLLNEAISSSSVKLSNQEWTKLQGSFSPLWELNTPDESMKVIFKKKLFPIMRVNFGNITGHEWIVYDFMKKQYCIFTDDDDTTHSYEKNLTKLIKEVFFK